MRKLKFILFFALAISFALLLLLYLYPMVRSFHRNEFKLITASQNAFGGFYKIPKDDISITGIDVESIHCSTKNYVVNSGTDEMVRSLPLRYPNARELDDVWSIKIAPHSYLQPLVNCILKNNLTRDSVMIAIDNFETAPTLRVFNNDSDTTLFVIANANFKRSGYCELGYIYAWPKKD